MFQAVLVLRLLRPFFTKIEICFLNHGLAMTRACWAGGYFKLTDPRHCEACQAERTNLLIAAASRSKLNISTTLSCHVEPRTTPIYKFDESKAKHLR